MPRRNLTIKSIRTWCEREGLAYRYLPERKLIGIPMPDAPHREVRLVWYPERKMMVLGMALARPVPRERYPQVFEALSVANSSIFMGAWVMNHDNGELIFRVTMPSDGFTYTDGSFRYLVELVVSTVASAERGWDEVVLAEADPSTITAPRPRARLPEEPDWAQALDDADADDADDADADNDADEDADNDADTDNDANADDASEPTVQESTPSEEE